MTLQASGPISINDIATEFGLANNATFPSAFYGKGGAPASGALSLQDFYGRSNIAPLSVVVNPSPANAAGSTATVSIVLTGSPSGGSGSYSYAWSKISGPANMTISGSTNSIGATIQATSLLSGNQADGVFRLTVTDTILGGSSFYDVAVSLSRL